MNESLLIRIVFIFFGFLLIVSPIDLQAGEIDLSVQEVDHDEIIETPKKMTQKQMNELFGEDPYLGQTSSLQSPEGFSQREN